MRIPRALTINAIASAIVLALAATPVHAEVRAQTLSQLLEFSLQHNGDLKSFREGGNFRESARAKAGLLPNPILEFDGSSGALTGSSDESSLSLGISQEFLLTGKREKRLASADRELASYRWQLADRERILLDEVKTAYFTVLLSEQRLALAERSIALNRQLLDVAGERLAAGDIPELEVNLVKVELARSEGARITTIRELNQNRFKLNGLTGASPSTRMEIAGDIAATPRLAKNLDELHQLARGSRADLRALEAESVKGGADIELAHAESTPNLTAGLAVRRDTTSMEIGGVEGKETAYTIGLKLSIPLPIYDRNQAGIQEALARKSGSEIRLASLTAAVEREVEAAYAGLQNADSILVLYQTTILAQLEENLKLTQEAYRLGEIGVLAVIQEQKKFIEVNDGYLAAMYDRQIAMVKLETAVGTDVSGGAL